MLSGTFRVQSTARGLVWLVSAPQLCTCRACLTNRTSLGGNRLKSLPSSQAGNSTSEGWVGVTQAEPGPKPRTALEHVWSAKVKQVQEAVTNARFFLGGGQKGEA